jgi:MFS transporter, DHA2 family, methylenomycin A resistance protein
MLPPRLFRSASFTASMVTGLLINVVFYGLIFALSLFLQRHRGLSPLSAGLAFLPATGAIMASNVIAARAIRVLGTRQVIAVGALAMGLGCLAMSSLLAANVAALVAALTVIGFGIGLIAVPLTSALLGSVNPARSGIASGTLTAFRQTGSVLGVAMFGSLLASLGDVAGLHTALLIAMGLILAAAALSSRI